MLNLSNKYKLILSLIFIWGLVSFIYYPTLNAQYVWDDTLLFVNKTGLREDALSWELIASPVLPGTSYFRPLVFLTWYFEFNIFGQNPQISHFIGLFVFSINCSLVFLLGLVLSKKINNKNAYFLSLLAAIFYITHPSLVESTAWVSGRFDQFCTLFILLGLILFTVKWESSKSSMSYLVVLLISICYLLALFSKELGIIFPVLLFVFYVTFESKEKYLQLFIDIFIYHKRIVFFLGLMSIIYLVLRINTMPSVYHVNINENYFLNLVWDQILPLYAIKYYILQIFLPFSNVDLISPLNEIDNSLLGKIYAYLASIIVLIGIIYAFIKRSLSSSLFLCVFISLFLVLYFIPLGLSSNLGHSRFLTLPLAFAVLAIIFIPYGKIFIKFKLNTKILIVGLVGTSWLILSIFTVKSILPFWMNEYTLWNWAYKNHPNSALARYNYLYAATLFHKFDEVIRVAEKYREQHGSLEVADQSIYANALLNKGDKESLNYYAGVIDVLPKFHEEKEKNSRFKVDNFVMTAAQIGDIYSSYGIGLLIMNNDIAGALKNIKVASWYALTDQKANINYYQAIILYTNKEVDASKEIYNYQKNKDIKIGSNGYRIVPGLISEYCIKYGSVNTICLDFEKNNPFN